MGIKIITASLDVVDTHNNKMMISRSVNIDGELLEGILISVYTSSKLLLNQVYWVPSKYNFIH